MARGYSPGYNNARATVVLNADWLFGLRGGSGDFDVVALLQSLLAVDQVVDAVHQHLNKLNLHVHTHTHTKDLASSGMKAQQ